MKRKKRMTTLIIDANNMAYRMKYTYNLSNRNEDVSVVYGFICSIMHEIKLHHSDSVIICWDAGIPEYRINALPEYKKNRHTKDNFEDIANFKRQLSILQGILPHFGVSSIKVSGFEADDLMYLISKIILDDVIIISSDEDMLQCIDSSERIEVYNPIKKDYITYQNFKICVGIEPEKFVQYKMLCGDGSDNIKGVPGIGPAKAVQLLSYHDSIECAWLTKDEDQVVEVKCYNQLHKVDLEYIRNLRTVIDLAHTVDSYLYCDVLDAIDNWQPYDNDKIKKFLIKNAFVSMYGGGVKAIMSKMNKPLYQEI